MSDVFVSAGPSGGCCWPLDGHHHHHHQNTATGKDAP